MNWATIAWWVVRSYWDDALIYIARWWATRKAK